MGRIPRIFSRPRATTVETVQRTLQCRSLLRPGKVFNERAVGVLAKALELYPVQLHAFIALSTHTHCLATYADPKLMADFNGYVNTNLSKEIGHIYDWTGTVFPDRYHHVELSQEPDVELARLRYIAENGIKENLVISPLDWPGVSSTESLISGEPMQGIWIDRTAFHQALDRGEDVLEEDFAEEKEVHLTPLPSLAHLPQEARRQIYVDMVRDIEEKAIERHKVEGTAPLGVSAILNRDPHRRPKEIKKSPRPWFHVFDPKIRKAMTTALSYLITAYQDAADRLREGHKNVQFPLHSFPPGGPFVREIEILNPG